MNGVDLGAGQASDLPRAEGVGRRDACPILGYMDGCRHPILQVQGPLGRLHRRLKAPRWLPSLGNLACCSLQYQALVAE